MTKLRPRSRVAPVPRVTFILLTVTLLLTSASGCAVRHEQAPRVSGTCSAPPILTLAVSATANEPAPSLWPELRDEIRDAAEAYSADPVSAPRPVVAFLTIGQEARCIDLTPLLRGGEVAANSRTDGLIRDNLARLDREIQALAATGDRFDLLELLDDAVRVTPPTAHLYVVSSGLSSSGAGDLRRFDTWITDPGAAAEEVFGSGDVPRLDGYGVTFRDLGTVAGPQQRPSVGSRGSLGTFWVTVCERAGGACAIDDRHAGGGLPTRATGHPATVEIPSKQEKVATLRDQSLSAESLFALDSADLSPEGAARLMEVARAMAGAGCRTVRIRAWTDASGTVAHNEWLSQERADAAARVVLRWASGARVDAQGMGVDTGKGRSAKERRRVVVGCADKKGESR